MIFNKVRSFLSILIVLSMLLSVMPAVSASDTYNKYNDFPTGWSKEAMEHAVDNGLLYGRSDTTINPKDNLTRAEMATIINRVFGATIKADISKYTDVASDDWYYEEIAKAVNMRTFIGDSGSTMNPNENITREAVFTVIARALVLETEDYSSLAAYPDRNKVSDWAQSAAAILVSKGYIQGNDEGMLCPQCYITREEFAQMMYNIVKTYYVEEGKFNHTGYDSSLIRTTGVTLENVTIDGDLIIGDGVGYGTVLLNNVKINGRLLCRGGEKGIKLVNTTVKEYVVVYDVNGIVHFENYRTESVFKGIREITPATFLNTTTGGHRPSSGPKLEYYTVSFHNGSNQTAFDSIKVNKAFEESNRNLAALNKTLDGIYSDYIGTTLPAYNRNSLGYNNLNTEYEHQVNKEYLYEETPGVWSVFTENTTINKNIDVYYAAKRAVIETEISQISMPYTLELRYDSKSRLADSLKDALITTGATLEKNIVKNEINAKLAQAYSKINAETGMVDINGNILDRDYGLRIIDVIEYNQIKAQVKKHIDQMLNGDADSLKAVLSFFDIPVLVEEIGGKELINLIGADSLRTTIKSDDFKGKGIAFIQTKIKADPNVIISVLNSPSKNTLIDSIGNNNLFIAKLIDYNATIRNEVLSILETDSMKTELLSQLERASVKTELIKLVKSNVNFKNSLLVVDNTNENYESSLALRKALVGAVAEPGKVYGDNDANYETMSASAKKVRNAVINVIDSTPEYAEYRDLIKRTYVYEAIVQRYATGSHSFTNIRFQPSQWTEYIEMIDKVLALVVEKYFSTNVNDQLDGDVQSLIDNTIVSFAKKYINGEAIINGDANSNGKINKLIEDTIISFIKAYFNGQTNLTNDPNIQTFANNIKTSVIAKVKTVDVSTIQQPIVQFVTDPNNADLVDNFVSSNYIAIVDALDNNFIMTFINSMTDDEVNSLVIDNVDIDLIVSHITGMTPYQRQTLANQIVVLLDNYTPYKEFMKAFEEKRASFEINKSNTHFVSAVGKAIDEFNFDEILQILKNKGFGPVITFLGEDVIKDMFDSATDDYWRGLEPLVNEVETSTDANIKKYYTTSLNVPISVPLILHGIYDNYANEFIAKIESSDIYDYDQNEALRKFVNLDWFELLIGYDPARIDETTGVSGYYFRDYMDYYCLLLDTVIIYDDALCFYDSEAYDDEEFKLVKKSLTKEFLAFIEKLEKLPENIANGNPIAGSYSLQDLITKVDSINNMLSSFDGTGSQSQATAIQNAVNSVREILVNLGQGNLPNGNTLDDLTIMCNKLTTVINSMNENEYENINATFAELIASAMDRLDAVIDEIDQTGNLPANSIISRISVLSQIYNSFSSQIKTIVSAVADIDLGSIDITIDSEKYEDILFGREEDNIFNIDSIIEAIKGRLGAAEKQGYDEVNMVYIIDQYSKTYNNNKVLFQRKFY